MSRHYTTTLSVTRRDPEDNGEHSVAVTVTGTFEDGELECTEVYEPKGLELDAEEQDRAEEALCDEQERVQDNGYQGD